MEISSFSQLFRKMITQEHMAGTEVWAVLIPQPVASALTPQLWYPRSMDTGQPVGCWESDGCWTNHIFGVRKKPRLTLPCDLMAQVRLEDR